MKKKVFWFILVFLILIAVIYGVLNFYLKNFKGTKVKVEEAKKRDLNLTILASQQVVAKNKVEIVAPVNGKIAEVKVYEGKKVQKNEVLVVFNKEELQYQVDQAQGAYEAAVAQRDKVKKAKDKGQATEEDLKAAEGEVKRAQAALDLAKLNLSKAEVKSPIDGIATSLKLSAGSEVMAGTPLLTIIDPSSYVVRAEIDETDIEKIKVDTEAEITFDAFPDKIFAGKVKEIGVSFIQTETGSKVFPVDIQIIGIDLAELREGLSGDVEIKTSQLSSVLTISIDSVVENSFTYVFQVNRKEKTVVKKKVELGHSSDEYVEVRKGLKEGDLVVVNPPSTLVDGSKVCW